MAEGALRSNHFFPTVRDAIHLSDIWNEEGDSINSKKKVQLANIKEDFKGPPRIYDPMHIEDTDEMHPLEYYDNDDGYWDGYIQEKERLRGLVPIPRSRPFYKH